MGHDHGHDHAHGLAAVAVTHRRPLAWVLAISTTILVVEVVGAFLSGSLALLADAGHMLTDVAGLSMALVAATLALRPRRPSARGATAAPRCSPPRRRPRCCSPSASSSSSRAYAGSWTRRRSSPAHGGVRCRRAPRQRRVDPAPEPDPGPGTSTPARRSSRWSTTRSAPLAVLVAALLITWFGWLRADAVTSIAIGLLIVPRTLRLLRETVDVLLEATPRDVDLTEVRQHILGASHVIAVHDLHASRVSSDLPIVTAHVVVEDGCFHDGHIPPLLDELQTCLADHFDVAHSTFQFEPAGHGDHESGRHD